MKAALLALLAPLVLMGGQQLGSLDQVPAKSKQYVAYVAEQQVIPAGKSATVELHFRVQDGFHINSHTPKSELLIPTNVELAAAAGVKVDKLAYPAGKSFSFSFDPGEKLDVYADSFTVTVPVTATAGQHELSGTLKYQACDHAACYPPKTLAVVVPFTAR